MAFRGHFEHSLDAKNRLTIPSKFRAAFASGVVLAPYFEPCVTIWTPEGFEAFVDDFLPELKRLSPRRAKLTRFFSEGAFDAELDAGGRVTLNRPLLEHAGIAKDVVIGGNLDHLEVWDSGRWSSQREELGREVQAIAESYDDPD